MTHFRLEAALIAVGLIVGGFFVKSGLNSLGNKDRGVNVKGLAEIEVPADHVTWTLRYKLTGNDLQQLYKQIHDTNEAIIGFFTEKGIAKEDVSVTPPDVEDTTTDRYSNRVFPNRYFISSGLTVNSSNVEAVRHLIDEQGELMQFGIAVSSSYANYEFTKLNEVKPKMIEEATKNARAAADKFAEDSGSSLGAIKYASQGQFSIYDLNDQTPYIKRVRVVSTVEYMLED